MLKLDVLSTAIVLLFKERTLTDDPTAAATYDSRELVKSILDEIKPKKKDILEGDTGDNIPAIISLLQSMSNEFSAYDDKVTLLGELKILFRNNPAYYDSIKDQIEAEMTDGGKKRSINNLKNKIFKYYNELKALKLLNNTVYKMNNDALDGSIQEELAKILPQLENLAKNNRVKGPETMDKLILSRRDEVGVIMEKIKREKEEGGVLKTGWIQLNNCINGGFRRGETTVVCALQHNYKSGFMQSILMQVARWNKPKMYDPKKKPLLLYISLEDEVPNILKFMYRYLFYNENKVLPDDTENDISLLTDAQLTEYVMHRLGMNGYEIAILRADPAAWTYQDIFTVCTTYEAEGYEIHMLIVDYLSKLPLTGCDTSGAQGTGIRDLFNRLRNFCSAKDICFLSPHQISTEGKTLIRNGVSEAMFVKEIAGKGYTEGSRQIDQVVDLELYIAKARIDKKWCLAVQRGKHRGQPIIDDSLLYFVLPFPHKAPILENINDSNFKIEELSSDPDEEFNI